jgi:hypothetical protein
MNAFEYLSHTVSNFNPWWITAAAIMILLAGLSIGELSTSLVIACSLITLAILTALELHPKILLILYPTTLFTYYFCQKPIFEKLSSNESPYTNKPQPLKGQTGTLILRESKNESESYFYDYKKSQPIHEHPQPIILRTLRVTLDFNGETHSAIDESGKLVNNDKVIVTGELNGSLIVAKIPN